VEGWLMKPVGYEAGRRYPLILKIHGGPYGAYRNTFFRTFHVLSNAGFFVLYTNPRGSTGYGHEFTYATTPGWGEIDSEDYLAGVDIALEAYPDIDPALAHQIRRARHRPDPHHSQRERPPDPDRGR
jgi:dipeptidyl aminopeptidase/acylaminoacyl peptidase